MTGFSKGRHPPQSKRGNYEEEKYLVTPRLQASPYPSPAAPFGGACFQSNFDCTLSAAGAAQADAAVLLVDGSRGGFESGFEAGSGFGSTGGGQTREHAQLARSLGIEQMAVVVSKLDTCSYSQASSCSFFFHTVPSRELHLELHFVAFQKCGRTHSILRTA